MPSSWPEQLSETHFARTRDGWRIALHNYPRNSKKFPVLLCHGMGSNRHDLDFGREKSLAKFLHRNGYDVWVVELRGAGASTRPRWWNGRRYDWCFDDYVAHDLPAAIRLILRHTGASAVHWVGHSMGGMLAYPIMQTVDEGLIRTATTIGAPLMTDKKNAELAGLLNPLGLRLLSLLPYVPQRFTVGLGAVSESLLELALTRMDGLLWNSRNMEREDLRELARLAVENLPVALLRQMHNWYETSSFSSFYQSWNYVEHLRRVKTPLFVIAGAADGLCPPEDCRLAYDLVASTEKRFAVFGTESGCKLDYGHVDLVLGREAFREVFPEILGWLEEFNDI